MSRHPKDGRRRRLDQYWTPDQLARVLVGRLNLMAGDTCLEPHVGGGAFARALVARQARVTALDIDPTAPGLQTHGLKWAGCQDFLTYQRPGFDWVIGNPPYKYAEAHVRHALARGHRVAFLLRLGYLESRKRVPFWREWPAAHVSVLAERPSFTGTGTDATAYGFFQWNQSHVGPTTLDVITWRDKGEAQVNPAGNRAPDPTGALVG